MIEFRSKKPKVSINLDDTVSVEFITHKSFLADYDNISDNELIISVKDYKQRRSLSQNSYMWVLLGKLGEVLIESRESLYKHYIKDYGKMEYIPIKTEAVETFIAAWNKGRIGNFAEIVRESKFEGYTTIVAYYGSSLYNSTEMAHLIEPIVRDCEEQGIQTMTYDEFMLLHNENN